MSLKGLALFLDVDGTLVDIAPTPEAVVVDDDLRGILRGLSVCTLGAVALVSGRGIGSLDQLFQPLLLPIAGLHGFERRDASGAYWRNSLPPGELLFRARIALARFVERHPGLLLEDKRFALAVHYRQVPQLESAVLRQVATLVGEIGPDFEMQRGRCVAELRPAVARKAAAIAAFMQEPPFRGRRPVCLGDDLTDECAFEWVNQVRGLSVAVGVTHHSAASAHLPSVAAARAWLRTLIEHPE